MSHPTDVYCSTLCHHGCTHLNYPLWMDDARKGEAPPPPKQRAGDSLARAYQYSFFPRVVSAFSALSLPPSLPPSLSLTHQTHPHANLYFYTLIFTHLHMVAIVVPCHDCVEEGVVTRHRRDGRVIGMVRKHASRAVQVPLVHETSGFVLQVCLQRRRDAPKMKKVGFAKKTTYVGTQNARNEIEVARRVQIYR